MMNDTDAAKIAMDVTDDKAAEMTCEQYDAEHPATETPIYCPTCGRMKTVLGVLHTTRSFCHGCLCYRDFVTAEPVTHYSRGPVGHGKLAACGAKVWARNHRAMAPSTGIAVRVTCPACLGMSEAEHEMMAEVYNS